MTSVAVGKRPKLSRRMARERRPDQTTGAVNVSAPISCKRQAKAALVLDMLVREDGASLKSSAMSQAGRHISAEPS